MASTSVEWMKEAVRAGRYRLTLHAEVEREGDAIAVTEIDEAFGSESLELLEEYPIDPRGPSALFLGFTRAGNPLHAVVATPVAHMAVFVNLYRPDPTLWYDWRTRA